MSVDVKKSIAAIALATALGGGIFEGVKPVEPIDTVAPMEIVAERTETATVFDAGGGKRMAVIRTQPVHWKDENGEYKKIDTTLQARALLTAVLSKYEYETAFTKDTKAFFDRSNVADYGIEKGEYSLDIISLVDTTGVDIKTETTTRGVKQTYILRDERVDATLKWLIDTKATAKREGDGFVFTDDEGAFLWKIEPPIAWDANMKPVPVAVSVSASDATAWQMDTLTWEVDTYGAAFPVTVDPSTEIITSTFGRYVRGGYTGDTYLAQRDSTDATQIGAVAGGVNVGQYAGVAYYTWRGVLQFDTSGIDDGAVFDSVKVMLCVNSDNSTTDFDIRIVDATFTGEIAMDWYNDFIGWASSGAYTPTYFADAYSTLGMPAQNDTLRIKLNATGLNAINKTGDTNYFLLSSRDIDPVEPSGQEYVSFVSASVYMKLWYWEYIFPSPASFDMTVLTSTSIRSTWTNPIAGYDSLLIMNSPENTGVIYATNGQATTVDKTGLTPNTLYTWFVRADSSGTKGDSNADSLYTLANPPTAVTISAPDTTFFSVTWAANSNPDSTLYAIRIYNATDDSTYYWTGTGLAGSATWKTRPAWTLAETITGITKDTNYHIGIVAKNGDNVLSAYSWNTVRTADETVTDVITYTDHLTHNVKAGCYIGAYLDARGESSADSLSSANANYIGQKELDGYYIWRLSWTIPIAAGKIYTAFTLHEKGVADNSVTDFNVVIGQGSWGAGQTTQRYYSFAGWQTGTTAYTTTRYNNPWSTSTFNATGDNAWVLNSLGVSYINSAAGGNAMLIAVANEDSAASAPAGAGQEYIEIAHESPSNSYAVGTYEYTPGAAYGVAATTTASQVRITWADSTLDNTGFQIVDSSTGIALSDTSNYSAEADTIYNAVPNTIYAIKVKIIGGTLNGTLSAAVTTCTDPGTPGTPVLTDLGAGLVTVEIDTLNSGNPIDTEYSVFFITSGADTLWVDSDSLRTDTHDENSSWGWYTYAQWGAGSGIPIQAEAGRTYTVKAISRSREY